MHNVRPMLATASTGASNRQPVAIKSLAGTHVFDLKVDGVRAILYRDPEPRLVNRNMVDITHKYPEIIASLTPGEAPALDGEIIADDGSFETTLRRDAQEKRAAIMNGSRDQPCRFIAFDMPGSPAPWERRRDMVEDQVEAADSNRIAITPYSDDPEFFNQAAMLGMEGVIAKRKTSRYQPGKRSPDWIKFKTVQRVTCVVIGYSPGHGSRAHFGNMHLAMLDTEHNPVQVGTVGSGFTERQTHELKALLDAGTILCVEIETLNLTSGAKLRHPVFKGIRSDLSPLDCTINQLDTLATC